MKMFLFWTVSLSLCPVQLVYFGFLAAGSLLPQPLRCYVLIVIVDEAPSDGFTKHKSLQSIMYLCSYFILKLLLYLNKFFSLDKKNILDFADKKLRVLSTCYIIVWIFNIQKLICINVCRIILCVHLTVYILLVYNPIQKR